MAVLEIILATTEPLPWTHLPVLMVILSLYLGLAYLTRATGNFWVYEWLSPQFGWWKIVLHVLGYTVAIVIIFAFVRYAIWTRNWLLKKYKGDMVDMDADLTESKSNHERDSSCSSQVWLQDPEAYLPTGHLIPVPTPARASSPRVAARI
jgi:hypothetical protein